MLDQRIGAHRHPGPLGPEGSVQDIPFRLKTAGATLRLFTEEAMRFIHQRTRGIQRSINNPRDLCLLEGHGAKAMALAIGRRVAQQRR
jgi:type II secretory pathway predicted ATPase ExeA